MNGDPSTNAGEEQRPSRLRYCPLEPGELVSWEECSRCAHRPEPPFTLCSARRRAPAARRRGFWDQEPVDIG